MSVEEKMALLEEMLEVEEGSLTKETLLENLEEWDSMSKMSLRVLMEDEFNRKINQEDIWSYHTIGDILEAMD